MGCCRSRLSRPYVTTTTIVSARTKQEESKEETEETNPDAINYKSSYRDPGRRHRVKL